MDIAKEHGETDKRDDEDNDEYERRKQGCKRCGAVLEVSAR